MSVTVVDAFSQVQPRWIGRKVQNPDRRANYISPPTRIKGEGKPEGQIPLGAKFRTDTHAPIPFAVLNSQQPEKSCTQDRFVGTARFHDTSPTQLWRTLQTGMLPL
jgi:hypothetical protein